MGRRRAGLDWLHLLEFELISAHGTSTGNGPRRQFQSRVGRQRTRNAPWNHSFPNFSHPVLAIQKKHIDCKFHPEAMDRLTWNDPKPLTRRKILVFQQPRPPLGASVRPFRRLRQHGVPRPIPYLKFQISVYNTKWCFLLRGLGVRGLDCPGRAWQPALLAVTKILAVQMPSRLRMRGEAPLLGAIPASRPSGAEPSSADRREAEQFRKCERSCPSEKAPP